MSVLKGEEQEFTFLVLLSFILLLFFFFFLSYFPSSALGCWAVEVQKKSYVWLAQTLEQ